MFSTSRPQGPGGISAYVLLSSFAWSCGEPAAAGGKVAFEIQPFAPVDFSSPQLVRLPRSLSKSLQLAQLHSAYSTLTPTSTLQSTSQRTFSEKTEQTTSTWVHGTESNATLPR